MFTLKNAQDRLAAMGIAAKVTVRGSDTFNIIVDLETDNHQEAYKASIPIWNALEAAGMTTLIGGHVGDHGDGYQTLTATIMLRTEQEAEPEDFTPCPKCGSPLSYYSMVRYVQCTNANCDYEKH